MAAAKTESEEGVRRNVQMSRWRMRWSVSVAAEKKLKIVEKIKSIKVRHVNVNAETKRP